MKKRIDGEGSLYWNEKRKRYIIAISVDGKRITRSAKTEKDAVKILQELRRKYGLIKYTGGMRLEEWYEEWLFEVKAHSVRPRTVASHKGVLENHIKPYPIAKMAVSEITKMDVTKFFNQLAKDGRSRQRLETIKMRLSTCFKEAEDFIEKNPVTGIKLPNAFDNSKNYSNDEFEVVGHNVFDSKQQAVLLSALGDNWVSDFLIKFILGTGLRISEALALTRLDYDGHNIIVRKQLQRIPIYVDREVDHYELQIVEVKTESSNRKVPLPEKLKAGLNARIKEIVKMEQPYKDQGLLFPTELGYPMDDKRPLRRLRSLERKLGLPDVTVHGLRHSYATRLLELGEPIQSISKLLGHSSVELTQDIYAHVLDEMKEKAVSKLDAIL